MPSVWKTCVYPASSQTQASICNPIKLKYFQVSAADFYKIGTVAKTGTHMLRSPSFLQILYDPWFCIVFDITCIFSCPASNNQWCGKEVGKYTKTYSPGVSGFKYYRAELDMVMQFYVEIQFYLCKPFQGHPLKGTPRWLTTFLNVIVRPLKIKTLIYRL